MMLLVMPALATGLHNRIVQRLPKRSANAYLFKTGMARHIEGHGRLASVVATMRVSGGLLLLPLT